MRALVIACLFAPGFVAAEPAPAAAPAPASSAPASAAAPVSDAAPTSAPPAPPATVVSAPGGRLTGAQLDRLGEPADSSCHAQKVEADVKAGPCAVLGPYPGEIREGKAGPTTAGHAAALAACAADPACIGVSSHWYIGGEWFPVTGGQFRQEPDSYGCTLLLRCEAP